MAKGTSKSKTRKAVAKRFKVTGTGNISLSQQDTLTVNTVSTANGSIQITAQDTMTVAGVGWTARHYRAIGYFRAAIFEQHFLIDDDFLLRII